MASADIEKDGDETDESSDEEEEFTGAWDDRVRVICHDMRTKKHVADQFTSERILELLKKNSKYVHAVAPSGKQLLHWAAYSGCEISAQLLLSRGARRDNEDIWKKCPYDYALKAGHGDSLLKLLKPAPKE
mmetsp:Transcript_78844/g.157578  ORF Transcript_78844/g.157578 Transcript_78844/m.157578 type:complete len:131 (-) Transcript_78844:59-451(-)